MLDETHGARELPRECVGARVALDCANDAAGRVVSFEQERKLLLSVRGHGRSYEAWMDDGNVNARPTQVEAQALEECRDGCLARAVHARLRQAAICGET